MPENQLTGLSPILNKFIVCGLGSLGQFCTLTLKEFGVSINAIEQEPQAYWSIPNLPQLIDNIVIGDCRQPKILEEAGIYECRAILLVTSDERINIEAAFAARSLNPHVRLIVRSAKENLNELLVKKLGNFTAFEATQLPVISFALGALGTEIRGFFKLENRLLRVMRVQTSSEHRWCDRRQLYEINNSNRRLLSHTASDSLILSQFYQWEPDARISQGDMVAYIEITDDAIVPAVPSVPSVTTELSKSQQLLNLLSIGNIQQNFKQFIQEVRENQTQKVAIFSGLIMLILFVSGTLLYKDQYPDLGWQDAINASLVLAIGGFDNLFGQLKLPFAIPWWLHFFSISETVAGTVFVGILYAILTEKVLGARFQLLKRRPPIPQENHVVLVGLGRVGQRIAKLLQELKQPMLAISSTAIDADMLSEMPLVVGNLTDALSKSNLSTARSVIAVTDDEVANLEIGLMAHTVNPSLNLVIRTFDPQFSENVARLLPYARVLGAYELAAEAFAAAALGENVLDLFRLNGQTTLVMEYQVEAEDTLNHRLIAEVAYGYSIVPILYQKNSREPAKFMPSDDVRLQVGDRLVVLATTEGLRRVEKGDALAKQWLVRVEKAVNAEAAFEGGMAIARISGCEVNTARELINSLPQTFSQTLYKHQAQRLVRELSKVQVQAHLVPLPPVT